MNPLIETSLVNDKQIDSINYRNKGPFKINKKTLSYILKEWDSNESTLFKGFNQLHPKTYDNVKITEYNLFKEIQTHNSIYYNNLNTIKIASLYKEKIFYLPTFLDFRGRIYSKVTYLSYIAGDLARALLEFNTETNKDFNTSKFNLIKKK